MDIDNVLKAHGVGGGSSSNIKSIQKGSISTNEVSAEEIVVTISPVDLKNSIVRIQYTHNAGSSGSQNVEIDVGIYFKTSTTIGIKNYKLNGYSVIYWEVVEFNNVKSLQSGTFNTYSGGEVAITPVNIYKSMLFYSTSYPTFKDSSDLNFYTSSFLMCGYLFSNNKVTFKSSPRSGDTYRNIYWQVIEFN